MELSGPQLEDLQQHLQALLARVGAACARVGRDPHQLTLVAVSKHQPVEKIAAALRLGHRDFGENYAQELRDKAAELAAQPLPAPRWHFIGPLQRNKVRLVVGRAALIHSIDSLELLEAVAARAAAGGGAPQRCLIQVNIGDEAQKSGCAADELPRLLERAAALPSVTCEGLMCIPPAAAEGEAARPFFQRLRALRDAHAPGHDALRELSMGMSQDFEVAIEEGATLIRVGTAIFGPRG